MIISLRFRLISGVVCSVALLLCISSLIIYSASRAALIQNFDKSLLNTAKMLSAVVEYGGHDERVSEDGREHREFAGITRDNVDFDLDLSLMREFNNPAGGAYFQLWDINGDTIIRSPSLAGNELIRFEDVSQAPQYHGINLVNAQKGRAVAFKFTPKSEHRKDKTTCTIVVARDAGDIYNHLAFLKKIMLTASAIVILLSIFSAVYVTHGGLKPVYFLSDEISAVDVKNLNKVRIAKSYPKELLPVVNCLNALLERLKISFAREKQFNSDVAHELRTPLAGIKSTIEVCLSQSRDIEQYKTALQVCLNVTDNMHRMINSLLSLAKLESKQQSLNYEEIALNKLISECWVNFADRALDRQINFENDIPEDIICISDKVCLSMIVSNIIDNAVEYCKFKGEIRITGQKHKDKIKFSVSNTGCKLRSNEAEKVFDSFWRADNSRKNTGRHCGIGLTVVKRVIGILNGNAEAIIGHDGSFTIRITLPDRTSC